MHEINRFDTHHCTKNEEILNGKLHFLFSDIQRFTKVEITQSIISQKIYFLKANTNVYQ